MPQCSFDIFLSYSSHDREWVEQLERQLTKRGIRVFLDRKYIKPGDNWVQHLSRSLRESRNLVIVLSGHFSVSEWQQSEWTNFLARPKRGAIIPVLLEEVEKPSLLEAIQHIDARALESGSVAGQIADAIGSQALVGEQTEAQQARAGQLDLDPFLPYTSDRRKQKRILKQAFQAAAAQGVPLVWFMHGEQPRQSLHTFAAIARRQVLLPLYAAASAQGNSVQRFSCRWAFEDDSAGARFELLRENLADALKARGNSVEDIGQIIANQPSVVVVQSMVYASEWRRNEPELISDWIRFWGQQELRPRLAPLQVCIIVQHDLSGSGFWGKLQSRRSHKRIVAYLESINQTPFQGVRAVVLPELPSISRSEALRWVDQAIQWFALQGFKSALIREHLEARIDLLYKDSALVDADRRIPMQVLADRLKDLLGGCRQEMDAWT